MTKFLLASSILVLSLALTYRLAAAGDVGTSTDFKGPTGLQLYSLRDMQSAKGAAAVLDQARAYGFKYVELSGRGKLTPAEYKAELDRRGLVPIGTMFPYERLRDDIEGIAREVKDFSLLYVGCAWIPHKGPFDEKTCREAAVVFNRAGAALAKHGIRFFYHTHGYEFQPHGQGTLFDLLAAETDEKTVFFEMDVLWVVLPGQDPVKLLEKYPQRWRLMHLKDLKKGVPLGNHSANTALTNDVAIGSGQVDWTALLRAAQKVGVRYYFIEDESPYAVEQIPQSLRFLESVRW
jgi:sugar phosphate isomerase/epimerase